MDFINKVTFEEFKAELEEKFGSQVTFAVCKGLWTQEIHHVAICEETPRRANNEHTSIYAFRSRHHHMPNGCYLHFDMRQSHELQEFITKLHNDAPVFEHKSVWDFYDAIGYDRKRKCFNEVV